MGGCGCLRNDLHGAERASGRNVLLEIAVGFTINAIIAVVLLRRGLLAAVVAYWAGNVLDIPITTHTSAWYHANAVGVLILLVAMAAWGLRVSMKGRRLLPRGLFT